MSRYNLSAPATIGPELMAIEPPIRSVVGSTGLAFELFSSAAEQINAVRMLPTITATLPFERWVVDIYPSATGATLTRTDHRFTPTAPDVVATNLLAAGAGSVAEAIDETSLNFPSSDHGFFNTAFPYAQAEYRGNLAGNVAGRRPEYFEMTYAFGPGAAGPHIVWLVQPFLRIGGVNYFAETENVASVGNPYIFVRRWNLNPATNLPWTVAELHAFATTSTWGLMIRQVGGATAGTFLIYQAFGTVRTAAETRVATGWADLLPSQSGTPVTIPVGTLAGAAWPKSASVAYSFVLRRLSGGGQITLPIVRHARPGAPAELYHSPFPTTNPWRVYQAAPVLNAAGIVNAFGTAINGAIGIGLRRSDLTFSQDSQAYGEVPSQPVYSGHNVEQEITPAANGAYVMVRAMIASAVAIPGDNLTIEVLNPANTVLASATITTADLAGDPMGAQVVEKVLSVVVNVTAGTKYRLRARSNTVAGSGWRVVGLQAIDAAVAVASFGGIVDQARLAGVSVATLDVAMTLVQQPTGPASATAAAFHPAGEPPYLQVTWPASTLGATYLRTEIERSENGGAYVEVATPSTEAVVLWNDVEAALNVPVRYRVRVIRSDQAPSAWVYTAEIVLTEVDCYWSIGSNEYPSLGLRRWTVGPTTEWTIGRRPVFREVYDRNNAMAFSGRERPGDEFTIDLMLWNESNVAAPLANPAPVEGRGAGAIVDAMNAAEVSQWRVRSPEGWTWYADVTFETLTRIEGGGRYPVRAYIRAVNDTPIAVDVVPIAP